MALLRQPPSPLSVAAGLLGGPRRHRCDRDVGFPAILVAVAVFAVVLADTARAQSGPVAVEQILVEETGELDVVVTIAAEVAPTFQVFRQKSGVSTFVVELPGAGLKATRFVPPPVGAVLQEARFDPAPKGGGPGRLALTFFSDEMDYLAGVHARGLELRFVVLADKPALVAAHKLRLNEAEHKRLLVLAADKEVEEKRAAAEASRVAAALAAEKAAEEKRQGLEQKKREEERKRLAALEERRKAQEQRRLAQEQRRAEEEHKRLVAEQARKKAEEEKRLLAEAHKKKLEEEKRIRAEAQKRKVEEEQRLLAEARKKAEDEKRLLVEAQQKKIEEDKRRIAEAQQKKLAEEQRLFVEAQQKAEADKRKELERAKADEAARVAAHDAKRMMEEVKQPPVDNERTERADQTAQPRLLVTEAQPSEAERIALDKKQTDEESGRRLPAAQQKRLEEEQRSALARQRAEDDKRRVVAETERKAEAERQSSLQQQAAMAEAAKQTEADAVRQSLLARGTDDVQKRTRPPAPVASDRADRADRAPAIQVASRNQRPAEVKTMEYGFGGRSVDIGPHNRYARYESPKDADDEDNYFSDGEQDFDESRGGSSLSHVTVQRTRDGSRVGIRVDGGARYDVTRRGKERLVLTLFDTRAANLDVRRILDARALDSSVLRVLPSMQEDGRFRVELVIETRGPSPVRIEQDGSMLWLHVS